MKKLIFLSNFILCIALSCSLYDGCHKSKVDTIGVPYHGINIHLPYDNNILSKLKELNMPAVRCDFDWPAIEPSKNQFNWTTSDYVIQYCYSENISILAVLSYTPEWANGNSGDHTAMFLDVNDWKNFISAVVNRYKDKIKYWEIWNEPNLQRFFKGSQSDYFGNILIPAAEVIKQIDTTASIVAPAISVMNSNNWNEWMDKAIEYKQYIDILSFHCYKSDAVSLITRITTGNPIMGDSYKAVGYYIKKYNGICWLTETGWEADEVGETLQKAYYKTFYDYIKNSNLIQRVFFYELMDDVNQTYTYGVYTNSLQPRKVVDYLKNL